MTVRAVAGGSSGATAFTGSIAATQVAFGSGANAFAGSANLTYNDTTVLLSVGSGSTTSAGFQIGYSQTTGISGIYRTGVTPGVTTAVLRVDSSNNLALSSNGGTLQFCSVNSANAVLTLNGNNFYSAVTGAVSLGQPANLFSKLYIDFTNTGTVGAVVINKAAGRVNVAAAGTSIIVTNSVVTAASKVFAVISQNDATATIKNVVPAAGSFTINLVAPSLQTSIDFFVVNAD